MRHKYSATQLAHAFCIRRPIQNTYTPPRVLVHTDFFFVFFTCVSDCFDSAVFRFEYFRWINVDAHTIVINNELMMNNRMNRGIWHSAMHSNAHRKRKTKRERVRGMEWGRERVKKNKIKIKSLTIGNRTKHWSAISAATCIAHTDTQLHTHIIQIEIHRKRSYRHSLVDTNHNLIAIITSKV